MKKWESQRKKVHFPFPQNLEESVFAEAHDRCRLIVGKTWGKQTHNRVQREKILLYNFPLGRAFQKGNFPCSGPFLACRVCTDACSHNKQTTKKKKRTTLQHFDNLVQKKDSFPLYKKSVRRSNQVQDLMQHCITAGYINNACGAFTWIL